MVTYWHINNLFNELPKELLSIPGWFIAGSSATCYPYNDIDIYFESEKAFQQVCDVFTSMPDIYYTTNLLNLIDVRPKKSGIMPFSDELISVSKTPIQLICKYFGTPEEILSKFDINICRNAILPDKTYYQHPSSLDLMYIDNITASSAIRLNKYLNRGFPIDIDRYTDLVHYLCTNPEQTFENFYDVPSSSPIRLLYELLAITPLLKITLPILLEHGHSEIIQSSPSMRGLIPSDLLPLEAFHKEPNALSYCHSSFASQHPELFI